MHPDLKWVNLLAPCPNSNAFVYIELQLLCELCICGCQPCQTQRDAALSNATTNFAMLWSICKSHQERTRAHVSPHLREQT